MKSLPPLTLYIHVPWCIEKCPYCDFNSHKIQGHIPEQQYVNRLLDDIRADADWAQQRPVQAIFFGGGTPSVLQPDSIARIIAGVAKVLPLAADCEITLEANPGTFEVERFAGFVEAGVNRLSIGIQSLKDQQLRALGRIHSSAQARVAAAHAKALGLRSYNLDLMHGLPEQSVADAMADLDQIIALDPPHISWYQLTIEPNTSFASRPPQLPDDDVLWDIYTEGHKKLEAAGYQQYEVSAYAKAGHQSRHNRNYWEFGDYLGIGCGAHSKITLAAEDNALLRCEKVKHPKGYLDLTRTLRYRTQYVAKQDELFEFFMNRLRLLEPVPKQQLLERTHCTTAEADQALRNSIDKGWVISDKNQWRLTRDGHRFLNSVLEDLL
ncbi:YggW family oxidoreductase [Idiomarina tyrosinivorans]|uniref:Heme chaperone HemW n=1 Tax=Idiomarina tyrosinivorans TaxID=1445662 RepID=A0A432ZJW2_9GAMM|nr:radical SAM family heme chaperone HemW [Idiomarina tyrosinivorans]RUO78174.1 YggW family oxidoreductase [Idiomarina tyrosinivorans]